jgi:hypothetical protein
MAKQLKIINRPEDVPRGMTEDQERTFWATHQVGPDYPLQGHRNGSFLDKVRRDVSAVRKPKTKKRAA